MDGQGEISSMLARLPDGSLVTSVVIDDSPMPRHVYRVLSRDGVTISEQEGLVALTDFLDAYIADGLEPPGRPVRPVQPPPAG